MRVSVVASPRALVVFAISIVPFAADFLMVATYPSYMNETPRTKQSFCSILGGTFTATRELFKDPTKRNPLISSASFQSVFSTLKHYIQPILFFNGAAILQRWGVEDLGQQKVYVKLLVGMLYAVFYLCSAFGTRNSHKLKCIFRSNKMAIDLLFNALLGVVLAIGVSIHSRIFLLSLPLYLFLYVLQNLWKPWSLAAVSDLMGNQRRATVLSVENLVKSILEFALAPVVGYIAHTFSVESVFFGLGVLFLVLNTFLLSGDWDMRKDSSTDAPCKEVQLAEVGESKT